MIKFEIGDFVRLSDYGKETLKNHDAYKICIGKVLKVVRHVVADSYIILVAWAPSNEELYYYQEYLQKTNLKAFI